MEAVSKKFHMIFAIVATIIVGAAMIPSVAPSAGEPARMPVSCPPNC
jgi:hypothetical protein